MGEAAQWIGEHAVEVFMVALAALLAFWFGLWRCVERYEEPLWRALGFVARRIAPYRYLSLHLLAGLAVCFAAVFAFGSLADEILERESWYAFDRALAVALNRHATPLGAHALGAITRLGDARVITALGLAVALGLALRDKRVLTFRGSPGLRCAVRRSRSRGAMPARARGTSRGTAGRALRCGATG